MISDPSPTQPTSTKPSVTVVIPAYNAGQYLDSQLAALSRQSCSNAWEVIVSDNGSTDDTLAVAHRWQGQLPNLQVICASGRRGAAHARNAGVGAGVGEAILFCDADDEVGEGWLQAMAHALQESPLVAARLDRGKLNGRVSPSTGRQEGLQEKQGALFPFAFGAALGVQRRLHEAIAGFDEELADGCEDEDYCYRAQLAGAQLRLVGDAVVHYRVRSGPCAVYRQSRSIARANVLLYRKYRGSGMRRPSIARAIVAWPVLALRFVPSVWSRDRRVDWFRRLGRSVGRLQGSIRYHVLAP